MGAAPLPPSALSTVMKSGALSTPRRLISSHRSSIHPYAPMTALKPVGLPVAERTRSIMSTKSPGELTSTCRLGLMESWPTSMTRMFAISSVTFAPGKIPPLPGLAPWLSLISNILTCSCAAISAKRSSDNSPV